MNITFKGNKVTLKNQPLAVGDPMPEFTVTDNGLNPVSGSELAGIRIFAAVPSLDTGVCDMEIKKFNQKASELKNVSLYAVSMDLPFAQARWCGANGVDRIRTLSDYRDRSFGYGTGTFIEELALLTRAVILTDGANCIRYIEYVTEITDHPDYDKLYQALMKLR